MKNNERRLGRLKYIRRILELDNGHFIVHCQSEIQSRMLMNAIELHVDKIFRRTRCKEFEFNIYDPISCRIITIARIFFDQEDEDSYFEAFKVVFDTAEKDCGQQIPFGHLTIDQESPSDTRLKAILLDEHAGQIRGLAKYFQHKFPNDDDDYHIRYIVKTCHVHYERSINRLARKNHDDKSHQGDICLIMN